MATEDDGEDSAFFDLMELCLLYSASQSRRSHRFNDGKSASILGNRLNPQYLALD